MNSNHEPDRMLDKALSEYRDAEPLAGMDDRILRRIAGQPEPVSRRRAWILAAAAAVAMIVIASWLGLHPRPQQQTVATGITQPAQQAKAGAPHVEIPESLEQSHTVGPARTPSRRAPAAITPQVAQASRTKPGVNQFPAPVPMTAEEHALLALARTHPDALLARSVNADELSIAPIEIKPVAPEAGAAQGEQQ